MARVVSLIASATEIVCALGAQDQLIGRSHECDYPESITRLPVCTRPLIDVSASSRDIDRAVKTRLHTGVSIYEVHANELERLKPEVILTQAHCEVCAVSKKDVQKALGRCIDLNPDIVPLMPNSLVDIWNGIEWVSEALKIPERGRRLVKDLKSRMERISERAAHVSKRPRVACIEWIDPLMASGNWVPELVEMAGGQNLFGEKGRHSPWMSFKDLLEADPDIILIMPCGFGLERTVKELPALTSKDGWGRLAAVRTNHVYIADGNQYFNRPGPRLLDSLQILAEIFHPRAFARVYSDKAWRRLASIPAISS